MKERESRAKTVSGIADIFSHTSGSRDGNVSLKASLVQIEISQQLSIAMKFGRGFHGAQRKNPLWQQQQLAVRKLLCLFVCFTCCIAPSTFYLGQNLDAQNVCSYHHN